MPHSKDTPAFDVSDTSLEDISAQPLEDVSDPSVEEESSVTMDEEKQTTLIRNIAIKGRAQLTPTEFRYIMKLEGVRLQKMKGVQFDRRSIWTIVARKLGKDPTTILKVVRQGIARMSNETPEEIARKCQTVRRKKPNL